MLDFLLIVGVMNREAILDDSGLDIGGSIPRYGGQLLPRHFRSKINKANEIDILWNPRPTHRVKTKNNPDIENRIIRLYQEGYELRELALWFRVPKDRIKAILGKALIKTRQFGSRQSFYEWEHKKAQYHYCCAYCGKHTRDLERDHVVPLSAGGADSIDNIVPACFDCNRNKHASSLLDWSKFKSLQLSLK